MIRPSVDEFAKAMEQKLQEHDGDYGKEGWLKDSCSVRFLHDRLTEELSEARKDLNDCKALALAKECIDIANFAMMIWDRITTRAKSYKP